MTCTSRGGGVSQFGARDTVATDVFFLNTIVQVLVYKQIRKTIFHTICIYTYQYAG